MAKKLGLLVDTDVFIEYFNHQLFREFFESGAFKVYYSVVTKKELFSKEGLSESERKTIRGVLRNCRMIPLDRLILQKFSELRRRHAESAKEDCLIAAAAIARRLPLATRNYRHFRIFRDLKLYFHS